MASSLEIKSYLMSQHETCSLVIQTYIQYIERIITTLYLLFVQSVFPIQMQVK